MGAATLGHVLRAEIPGGLLGELIHALLAFSPSTAEVRLVVELLQAVSEARRYVTGEGAVSEVRRGREGGPSTAEVRLVVELLQAVSEARRYVGAGAARG